MLIDLAPGDEVIMPSFTFVSTANAIVLRGATPVFADVDPITFNLDPVAVEAAITPRTRAILPVHYAGVPADMTRLRQIAQAYGLTLIEDAAQALGSSRDGRPAGSVAPLAAVSFHATKNIVAGEAGALIINDPDLVERATFIREKGTNRAQFAAGRSPFYTWQDIGSSYVVCELAAAFLYGQLLGQEEIQSRRMALWSAYAEAFGELDQTGVLSLPRPPPTVRHNAHIFFVVLPDKERRIALQEHLRAQGVTAAPHFVPLHDSPAGRKYGRVSGSLENTQVAAECLLRLPLFVGLEDAQARVIDALYDWATTRSYPIAKFGS